MIARSFLLGPFSYGWQSAKHQEVDGEAPGEPCLLRLPIQGAEELSGSSA